MSKLATPHNNVFQSLMADIRVAREFFETYLPNDILEVVDLNHLELSPSSFVDEELKGSASDLLYKTQMGEGTTYLYLVEHQSTQDKLMPFRLLKYMMRIWDKHLSQMKEKKGDKTLPLIITTVFYHGREPYTYSRDIRDLISAPKELIEKHLFTPFHLVDTHAISDEKLREQHWFGTMAFFMKHIFTRDFLPYLQDALAILRQLEQSEGSNFVVTLLNYAITTAEINVEKLIETVKEGLSTSTGEKIMTAAEQLIERGKQYGLQQGLQQGELKGEQIMLMKLLHRRFPSIQSTYENRIKNACAEDLLQWGERILDAKSVDEVFEG